MRIVVTGGHGFIGSVLTAELLARGTFCDAAIDSIVLLDKVAPPRAADASPTIRTVQGDLRETIPTAFAEPVNAVFHLASAVSAECEADFDLGMHANLAATLALLEAARAQRLRGGPLVTVVFSSSVAVYGSDPAAPLPPTVSETTLATPQSSYGTQKLACEQILADYTRKGFVDGRVVRLMTVVVRPGKPNAAASAFVSGIIREPLRGLDAPCPVGTDVDLAIASPRRTVTGILRVAEVERGENPGQLSGRIPVNLPALTVSVAELLAALRAVAGAGVTDHVIPAHDPAIETIVRSWPARFDDTRARALGLEPDPDVTSVIRQYLDSVCDGSEAT